jgi:putative ATP-dependent endonuclease of OLD family
MYISKIAITNYRGIKQQRTINLEQLSSIVGKNDAGKTIVLYAIATFLDVKNFPITYSDFNDIDSPILFEFDFKDENFAELLMTKLKGKVKKADGLEEYVQDFLFDSAIKFKREAIKVDKKFSSESILIKDYQQEDIRGLYLKTDDELNVLIQHYEIQIPVDGKGRNSKFEKIKHIKQHFVNAERTTFWIEDDCKISSLFPEVEMFKADYGLEADTKFKTNSVTEIQDYFDREAKNDDTKLKKVEAEIIDEMKKEAQSVTGYMQDYASTLKAVQIIPVVNWKDAIKGVDVSFQFDGDEKFIPMSHKGTGYRRLFMVARFRYLAEKSKGHNIIYLIEEPETFLHPTAQQDLLNAFKDLSNDNQIIITTHSPVFAGATSVNGVVLCSKDNQSNYENASKENDTDFLLKIVEELGIKPSYNLRDDFERILFVEGQDDATFYKILCDKLFGKNLEDKVLVLPSGGSSIDSFINISYFKKNGRDLYLILDSDKGLSKKNPEKPLIQAKSILNFNNGFGKGYALKKSNIESYFHPLALKRFYPHLDDVEVPFFEDNQDLSIYFMENKISKKQNTKIFNEMTKEEFEEITEQELIDFLMEITNKTCLDL